MEKSCGAVVYKKENNEYKFLVIKQEKGHYSFPKGHVEGNETEEQTAYREIEEETNVKVKIDNNFRYKINYTMPNGINKDVIFFLAEYIEGKETPQEGEVTDIFWLNKEETLNSLTYDDVKEVFTNAIKYLK